MMRRALALGLLLGPAVAGAGTGGGPTGAAATTAGARCTPADPAELEAAWRAALSAYGSSASNVDGAEPKSLPEPALGLLRKGAKKLSRARKKKGDRDLLSLVAGGSAENQQRLVGALSAALFVAAPPPDYEDLLVDGAAAAAPGVWHARAADFGAAGADDDALADALRDKVAAQIAGCGQSPRTPTSPAPQCTSPAPCLHTQRPHPFVSQWHASDLAMIVCRLSPSSELPDRAVGRRVCFLSPKR